MPTNIITIQNVNLVEFTVLMEMLSPIYNKDIPNIDVNHSLDSVEMENLMIFFSNNYAYITELWARMAYEVRLLKRTSQNKDAIDLAMDSRDYLEKVMNSIKIKFYAARALLQPHRERV